MVFFKINSVILFTIIFNSFLTLSGQHVYHRIHVPTKVKTIYHTKIIKIPEHHHYIHEKEKPHLVKVPEHHHYFHEKEKEHPLDFHHKDDELDVPEEYENDHDSYSYHDGYHPHERRNHNIFKKHAPTRYHKKRKH